VKIPSFRWWRTVFFLVPAVTLLTIVTGTISVVSIPFDRTGRAAHAVARWWARGILVVTGVRVGVTGLDRLEPGATYVFVANHQSFYDIPVLFWSLPYQLRIIAKESLGSVPFLGWHLRRTGHILVDRSNPDRRGILKRWRQLVTEGLSLIIFPEGTRSRDGHVGRFKSGSFLLALQAGLPVVPLTIVGTRAVMPKGRLAVAPETVTLTVHPPVATRGRVEDPDIEDARALAAEVRAIVSADIDELERGQGSPRAEPPAGPGSRAQLDG
jgi:1-acyl-sn-glycerol-3-phosphate acyltransferase